MAADAGWMLTWIFGGGFIVDMNDNVSKFLRREGLEGFDDQDKELATSRIPYRHGVVAHGEPYAPARTMSVAIDVLMTDAIIMRRYLRNYRWYYTPYLRDGAAGTLLLEDAENEKSRAIECRCMRIQEIYRAPAARTLVYHFKSEDAFFYDPTEQAETLALSTGGGLEFPVTFPVTFTSADIDETLVIDNTGEALTWPTIRIYGPGDNPSFENTTIDKKVALTVSMDAGDYIDIDMEAATVMMYDATAGSTSSIIEDLSDDSEFWPLMVWYNSIDVNVENVVNGSVVFSYYLKYLGI